MPTCPEWTLRDLIRHPGTVHRRWASIVTAGPDATAPAKAAEGAEAASSERDAPPAWSAASTRRFLDALREAGPDGAHVVGWLAVAADLLGRRAAPGAGGRGAHL
ncbi:maleylpyruvate isomerase N-terminal domain-containing protein [Streptomyces sp. MB22_4]|uniref:maleylpyruvate isomerase N-terminal domain-containing protein n=1 Tax=Streptomyces sp. MB22_4 TaxID=3383120 RepID=UPI0039A22823